MIDLDYLTKLLAILGKSQVSCFKMADLELKFHVEPFNQSPVTPTEELSSEPPTALVNVDESSLPADLKSDTLMNMDKVLNWSAPNDQEPQTLPLVEEAPL